MNTTASPQQMFLFRLLAGIVMLLMLALPTTTLSQTDTDDSGGPGPGPGPTLATPVLITPAPAMPPRFTSIQPGTWNGTTSQGERIIVGIQDKVVTFLSVGVHMQHDECSARYTSVHYGILGYLLGNQFTATVEDDNEWVSVEGTLYEGGKISGSLRFTNKSLSYVCPGSLTATWWTSADLPHPTAILAPEIPVGPSEGGTWPVPPTPTVFVTPTQTPTRGPETSWEGVPEWAQPTRRPTSTPRPATATSEPYPGPATATSTHTPTSTQTPTNTPTP
jgi:hypothetical protein